MEDDERCQQSRSEGGGRRCLSSRLAKSLDRSHDKSQVLFGRTLSRRVQAAYRWKEQLASADQSVMLENIRALTSDNSS